MVRPCFGHSPLNAYLKPKQYLSNIGHITWSIQGTLAPAINPQATLTGSLLTLNWELSDDLDWGIKNDRTMLLVYCPELNLATYVLSGARRSSGTDDVELPGDYIGKELQIYIAFKASNGKSISDSVWALVA